MGQSSHLDTPLLELQNTKKLYGTKNNCAHVQLGQILDQKIQKRQKEPSAISEELGPKPKVWQKQSAPSPTLNTTKGKADHLNYPTTTLTHVRKELGLLTWGDNRRARFTSYNQCRSPSTTLPEFLLGSLGNFPLLGEDQEPWSDQRELGQQKGGKPQKGWKTPQWRERRSKNMHKYTFMAQQEKNLNENTNQLWPQKKEGETSISIFL